MLDHMALEANHIHGSSTHLKFTVIEQQLKTLKELWYFTCSKIGICNC